MILLLNRRFIYKLSRSHEIYENLPKRRIRFENLYRQLVKVEYVANQRPHQTEHVSVKQNLIVQHEDLFLLRSYF